MNEKTKEILDFMSDGTILQAAEYTKTKKQDNSY